VKAIFIFFAQELILFQ